MARTKFLSGDEFAIQLSKLADQTEEVAKKAIYAGASIVADELKKSINALPTEKFRLLKNGEQFNVLAEGQKKDLTDSLGITPIGRDREGNWNVKIGFDGYGGNPTKKYPLGLPNQLLARAIESGSSVRRKHPFVRPTMNRTKKQVIAEMTRVIDEESKRIIGE